MKNKNGNTLLLLIIAIVALIVMYNIISLSVVKDKTSGFWVTYAFTMIAFAIQFVILLIYKMSDGIKANPVLGVPFIVVCIAYLLFQLLVGIIMVLANASSQVSAIIEGIILCIFIVVAATSLIDASHATAVESSNRSARRNMKQLIMYAGNLYNESDEPWLKEELKKVYEALQYSDISSETSEIILLNGDIMTALEKIKELSQNNQNEELPKAISSTLHLISRRNTLCKLAKN